MKNPLTIMCHISISELLDDFILLIKSWTMAKREIRKTERGRGKNAIQ